MRFEKAKYLSRGYALIRICIVGLILISAASDAIADSLSLTIKFQDLTAGPSSDNSVTVTTNDFHGVVFAALGPAGSVAPISYNLIGYAISPGTLSTTVSYVRNISSTPHEVLITFDALYYTQPSTSPVTVDTQLTVNDKGGLAGNSSLSASALGGVLFTQNFPFNLTSPSDNDVASGVVPKTGSYEMKQVYDLWVVNNPGKGSLVSSAIRMDISGPSPAPEPWTLIALATMAPVGGILMMVRRRKLQNTLPVLT